jgi:hypothetical protein
MRKPFLVLLLLGSIALPRWAAADPLSITGGRFLLDIEGDIFTFSGSGFSLTTTGIGIYSRKAFPGRCSSFPFGFCAEAEGATVDWSFQTTGGEQLLGTGSASIDGTISSGVDFLGTMTMNVVPTALSSGGTNDFDFVAPFLFQASIRGVRGAEQLFARTFAGRGLVRVNYEGTLTPGVFAAADESVEYEFSPAATPEPASLVLFGTGLAGAALRRRRRSTHSAKDSV